MTVRCGRRCWKQPTTTTSWSTKPGTGRRVSRKDQRLELQRDALLADGCERVAEEKLLVGASCAQRRVIGSTAPGSGRCGKRRRTAGGRREQSRSSPCRSPPSP